MPIPFHGPGPDAIYASQLEEGRFAIQRCDACNTYIFYPRVICTKCGKAEPPFVTASGLGVVYSTTVQRRRPEQGGDQNLALVDLEEGPRMLSRIDSIAPHEVKPGLAVLARIIEEDGCHFVTFVPA